MTLVDDFSRMVWVEFLQRKSECFMKFTSLIAELERQKGVTLKGIHSDNGGEYTSNQFRDYCQKNGIVRTFSPANLPECNGVAEKMNRILLDMALSMRKTTGTPRHFWAEAVETASYIRNRCPTKEFGDKKTPFEVWTRKKPRVGHMRVWGSECYALIPKKETAI
jgi:transposase InsO family protein